MKINNKMINEQDYIKKLQFSCQNINQLMQQRLNQPIIINLMIIIRKIFANIRIKISIPLTQPINKVGSSLWYPRITNQFCEYSNKGLKLPPKQLHRKLIQQHSKLSPQTTAMILHFLQFNSPTPASTTFSDGDLNMIITHLSGNLYKLSHRDLTLLLETICKYPRYQKYSRECMIMRLIAKRINSLQAVSLDFRYLYRLLHGLEGMGFPYLVIQKYVNLVCNQNLSNPTQSPTKKYPKLDNLRFFISILQMPYIPVKFVNNYYNNFIANLGFSTPRELAHLYYIYQTVRKSLSNKISYFGRRIKMHQLVFNPYQHVENKDVVADTTMDKVNQDIESTNKDQQEAERQKKQQLKSYQVQQKQRMQKQCQQLLQKLQSKSSPQMLKQQLKKFYQFQKYPLQTTTAVFLYSIPELSPSIIEYLNKNYEHMQPGQFVKLLTLTSKKERSQLYQKYVDKNWGKLELYSRLILVRSRAQAGNPPNAEEIEGLFRNVQELRIREFDLIMVIVTKYMQPEEQTKVISMIDRFVSRESHDGDQVRE